MAQSVGQRSLHVPPDSSSALQVRARTFYAEKVGADVADVDVPVVGGHAGVTILPLFSQATPSADSLSAEQIDALTKRTQGRRHRGCAGKGGQGKQERSLVEGCQETCKYPSQHC